MTANIPDRDSPEWETWAAEHPLHKLVIGAKPNKANIALRVEQMVRWISTCRTRTTILQLAAEQWGVSTRSVDTLHAEAVRELKNKFTQDRPDYLVQKMEQLEHLVQTAIDAGQLSAAAGAMGLLLRAAGCADPFQLTKQR